MKLIVVNGGNAIINADTVMEIYKNYHALLAYGESKNMHRLTVYTNCGENGSFYDIGSYTDEKICNTVMDKLSDFLASDDDITFRALNDVDFIERFPEVKIKY